MTYDEVKLRGSKTNNRISTLNFLLVDFWGRGNERNTSDGEGQTGDETDGDLGEV